VLPFGAAVHALRATWVGQAVEAGHLASLGITTVAAGVLAVGTFRWDRAS
jgi:hypothetical protein